MRMQLSTRALTSCPSAGTREACGVRFLEGPPSLPTSSPWAVEGAWGGHRPTLTAPAQAGAVQTLARLATPPLSRLAGPALALALGAVTLSGAPAVETVWFGGAQRALPVNLVGLKEDGIRSTWSHTDDEVWVWDFNLGTDISIWQRRSESTFQSAGPRFGIASRFEFGSESFDLWAADFRGGGAWGLRRGPMAYEVLLFHESSHLGDEIIERGDRTRQDVGVNGIHLTVSRQWNKPLRTYGGVTGIPWADPDELQSLGFHAGAECTGLPPWDRGYVAAELEMWEWRDWNPDFTAQIGLFLSPCREGNWLSTARAYFEFRTGHMELGQFFNETETRFGLGLALDW